MRRTSLRLWLLGAGLLGLGGLTYLLAPILTPFLAGALLAYLGDPLADRLESLGLKRTPAVLVVFFLFTLALALLVLVLVPLMEGQAQALARLLPRVLEWIDRALLPRLAEWFDLPIEALDVESLRQVLRSHWQQAGGLAARVLGYVTSSGAALAAVLANLVLIPVVTFYMLRDWDVFMAHLRDLLPRSVEPTVTALVRESDEVLAAFLRGQLTVMLALAVIYSVGLWLAGLELALAVGLLAGLVSFVPYLGVIVGVLSAGLAMLLQTGDPMQLLPVAAVFAVGQVMEGYLLTPLLVGERIGLHPVAVIFAVLAGGQLFGFVGVLLALPVAAVLAVLLRHLHRGYKGSALYGRPGAPGSGAGDEG